MRLTLIAFVLVSMLSACAIPPGNAVPQAARLSADVLTLTLSDGTVCRANWAASGGSGRFDDCGVGYGYSVALITPANPLRQIAEGIVNALDAEGVLPPLAEVTITDAAGIDTSFASPVPVE